METTEKIVESYVRYVKGWATISNIKCGGQLEIDLLAIDPKTLNRYHIESGVHTGGFSKLTARQFDPNKLKVRVEKPKQRRTLGFFRDKKLSAPQVIEKLKQYGFEPGNYTKIIVTWGWEKGIPEQAREAGIVLWDFRALLKEIASAFSNESKYFTDDTLRTIQLFCRAMNEDDDGSARIPEAGVSV